MIESPKKIKLNPRLSLMDQAEHSQTFGKRVDSEIISQMSDMDLAVRATYLEEVGGYFGWFKDKKYVQEEMSRRGVII